MGTCQLHNTVPTMLDAATDGSHRMHVTLTHAGFRPSQVFDGSCAVCGDGACAADEACDRCPADCAETARCKANQRGGSGAHAATAPLSCGNGRCETASGETCKTCPVSSICRTRQPSQSPTMLPDLSVCTRALTTGGLGCNSVVVVVVVGFRWTAGRVSLLARIGTARPEIRRSWR